MKRIIAIILALVLLTTPVAAQTCDLTKAKHTMTARTGIFEYKGHWYLYIGGKMQLGHIRYKGNYYYAHRTSSKRYPKGSLTKGQFRIEKGNRWFAYSIDHGKMYVKNHYIRKGRFKRFLDLAIRKDRTVAYVYDNSSTVRGAIRYSTAERRLQRDEGFGDWHTVEGMQFIPDGWVDTQR